MHLFALRYWLEYYGCLRYYCKNQHRHKARFLLLRSGLSETSKVRKFDIVQRRLDLAENVWACLDAVGATFPCKYLRAKSGQLCLGVAANRQFAIGQSIVSPLAAWLSKIQSGTFLCARISRSSFVIFILQPRHHGHVKWLTCHKDRQYALIACNS